MARLFAQLTGKRLLVLAIVAIAAALNARGVPVHTNGFFDGPH